MFSVSLVNTTIMVIVLLIEIETNNVVIFRYCIICIRLHSLVIHVDVPFLVPSLSPCFLRIPVKRLSFILPLPYILSTGDICKQITINIDLKVKCTFNFRFFLIEYNNQPACFHTQTHTRTYPKVF